MKLTVQLAKEAVYVGVVVVVLGIVLHMLSLKVRAHNLNDMKVYAAHLFATAVLAHLAMEYAGVNKWYCSNGVACSRT
jgi:hypothetical protein